MSNIYILKKHDIVDVEQWMASAEDGFTLGFITVGLGQGDVAKMKLSFESQFRANYLQHYPNGFNLINIDELDAVDQVLTIKKLEHESQLRFEERRAQRALASEFLDKVQIRDLTPDEQKAFDEFHSEKGSKN